MRKKSTAYLLALGITLLAAYYQRVTGPTYPVTGEVSLGDHTYNYRLPRSYGHAGSCEVRLKNLDPDVQAVLSYRPQGTRGPWSSEVMKREGNDAVAALPHQPTGGVLDYFITLNEPPRGADIGMDSPLHLRFHGEVPRWILLPHILFMFAAMWASTAAGLLAMMKLPGYKKMGWWNVGFLILGGMIFGPLVQRLAFGQFWTGFPFGHDLTNTKTLVALLCWLLVLWANWKKDRPKLIIAAAYFLLAVFCIPHSVMGSRLDYSTMKVKTG